MSMIFTQHVPMPGRKSRNNDFIAADINDLVKICHQEQVDAGWWHSISFGDDNLPMMRNVGELLCLIHSEISEAMEGDRKDLQDDKLPQYKMLHVELGDALIRICDLAGALNCDLGNIVRDKLAFNRQRADHKPENRALPGGKKF